MHEMNVNVGSVCLTYIDRARARQSLLASVSARPSFSCCPSSSPSASSSSSAWMGFANACVPVSPRVSASSAPPASNARSEQQRRARPKLRWCAPTCSSIMSASSASLACGHQRHVGSAMLFSGNADSDCMPGSGRKDAPLPARAADTLGTTRVAASQPPPPPVSAQCAAEACAACLSATITLPALLKGCSRSHNRYNRCQ